MSPSQSFPGFDKLYWLHWSGSDREFRADIDLRRVDPLEVTRGEQRLRTRAEAWWAMGYSVPGPLVWTRLMSPFLVSDDVVAALHDDAISGWGTYRVTLTGKNGKRIPGYHGFKVTGRCGAIDFSRGKRFLKQMPGGKFPYLRGIGFKEKSWDGSDIFMPAKGDGRGFIFVTERAKRTLSRIAKKARFESVDMIEISVS